MGDFENNKFYILLKTKFSSQYKAAKKNRCIICVPDKGWDAKTKFNRRFMESHIFKQSPRFLTEYVSVRKDQNLVIRIDDRLVTPVSGFDCKDSLQIINEELCYNENYEQFFVYLVDRIIGTPATSCVEEEDEADRNGRSETVTAANSTASGSISADLRHSLLSSKSSEETSDDEACNPELKTPVKTLEWYQSFLQLEPCYAAGLKMLTNEIDQFNLSYVIIGGEKDHIRNTAENMGMIYEKILQVMSGLKILETEEDESDLSIAVESCLIDGISAKLYRAVQAQCRTEIHNFSQLCPHFAKLSCSALKISESFNCDLSESSKVLSKLHSVVTPNDILNILQETIQRVFVDVRHHAKLLNPFAGRNVNVSADELVPLVARVICKSHLEDIEKYLQIAQHFRFAFAPNEGELNYAFTTFIASQQLILATFPDFKFDKMFDSDPDLLQGMQRSESSRTETLPGRSPRGTRFPRASLHFPNLHSPDSVASCIRRSQSDIMTRLRDDGPAKSGSSLPRFKSSRSHGNIREAGLFRQRSMFQTKRTQGMPTVIDITPLSRGNRNNDATGPPSSSSSGNESNSQAGIFGLLGSNPLWYCSNQNQYSARK